jgi:hypothetical protein
VVSHIRSSSELRCGVGCVLDGELRVLVRFEIYGQATQSDQPSLSIATLIMIATSNSPPGRGAGYPIISAVIYCTPWGFPGSSACEPSYYISS